MSLHSGERQVAESIAGVRRDHVARYEWAAKQIEPRSDVRDIGCGIGYGSWMLAREGHSVIGIDYDIEAITHAYKHFHNRRCFFVRGNVETISAVHCEIAIAFEIIEHLDRPERMLHAIRHAKRLICSVPNERVFPFASLVNKGFHRRHYTVEEFDELLRASGWLPIGWYTQAGPESEVEPGTHGRTLIADCERAGDA